MSGGSARHTYVSSRDHESSSLGVTLSLSRLTCHYRRSKASAHGPQATRTWCWLPSHEGGDRRGRSPRLASLSGSYRRCQGIVREVWVSRVRTGFRRLFEMGRPRGSCQLPHAATSHFEGINRKRLGRHEGKLNTRSRRRQSLVPGAIGLHLSCEDQVISVPTVSAQA